MLNTFVPGPRIKLKFAMKHFVWHKLHELFALLFFRAAGRDGERERESHNRHANVLLAFVKINLHRKSNTVCILMRFSNSNGEASFLRYQIHNGWQSELVIRKLGMGN